MIYNNTNTVFILRYIGVHQTHSQHLISFIITVLYKDISIPESQKWVLWLIHKVKVCI